MFGGLAKWWRRRQRRIDREILWPSMLIVGREDDAVSAMLKHAAIDPAWSDMSPDEAEREIRGWL